jgi:pimeloyl-ACP methyl ester carboxylesterase
MNLSLRLARNLFLALLTLLIISCTGKPSSELLVLKTTGVSQNQLDLTELGEGTEIRSAGLQLMENPVGLLELVNGDQSNDSVLIVAVHGYQSSGYEWVNGLKSLGENYGSLFFYRYDWDRCPDVIANELAAEINTIKSSKPYQKVVLFGHSYGGVVLTYVAAQLTQKNVEVHVIAAPLGGYPNLLDRCESLEYDKEQNIVYPKWANSIRVIQHRTVHEQDGAFRELETDPQVVDLPFYQVHELPPTMDGHRLGHNWSVTWVLDHYVGRPHRY